MTLSEINHFAKSSAKLTGPLIPAIAGNLIGFTAFPIWPPGAIYQFQTNTEIGETSVLIPLGTIYQCPVCPQTGETSVWVANKQTFFNSCDLSVDTSSHFIHWKPL